VAVAADDLAVRVYDLDTSKLVRLFAGHTNRLTDLVHPQWPPLGRRARGRVGTHARRAGGEQAFSPEARWLVTASLDATLRVWDLPTAACVDVLRLDALATSVAFSPVGDYLATTHVDHVGVYLWCVPTRTSTPPVWRSELTREGVGDAHGRTNRQQFATVSLRALQPDEAAALAAAPPQALATTALGLAETEAGVDALFVPDADTTAAAVAAASVALGPVAPRAAGLITLANVPKLRWQNLLHLDTLRVRRRTMPPMHTSLA
jgi:U3 small nucleolar RNA-associated protein 21